MCGTSRASRTIVSGSGQSQTPRSSRASPRLDAQPDFDICGIHAGDGNEADSQARAHGASTRRRSHQAAGGSALWISRGSGRSKKPTSTLFQRLLRTPRDAPAAWLRSCFTAFSLNDRMQYLAPNDPFLGSRSVKRASSRVGEGAADSSFASHSRVATRYSSAILGRSKSTCADLEGLKEIPQCRKITKP